jgi:hypothetical protein
MHRKNISPWATILFQDRLFKWLVRPSPKTIEKKARYDE